MRDLTGDYLEEHKCVLDSCRWLEQEGMKVTYLPVASNGLITVDQVAKAIRFHRIAYISLSYMLATQARHIIGISDECEQ